ncbi:MAG: IPT/TIG domain-containing protein [Actinomycetota bacterium]|nr:IPT/TIG domain-containing protein [Actinomycetota bacterium]
MALGSPGRQAGHPSENLRTGGGAFTHTATGTAQGAGTRTAQGAGTPSGAGGGANGNPAPARAPSRSTGVKAPPSSETPPAPQSASSPSTPPSSKTPPTPATPPSKTPPSSTTEPASPAPAAPGAGPRIVSVSPASGAAGRTVLVDGSGLFSSNGLVVARFGASTAPTSCNSESSCTVTVPDLGSRPSTVPLTILTEGGTSNSLSFSYT